MTNRRQGAILSMMLSGGAVCILAFQNCTRFQAPDAADLSSRSESFMQGFSAPSRLSNFSPALKVSCANPDPSMNALQVADALQACLDNAEEGATVELAPTTYRIQKPLRIRKSVYLRTAGLSKEAPACRENEDHRCAVIQAVSPLQGAEYGVVQISASAVALEHIVVDGDRVKRNSGAEGDSCRAGRPRPAFNITASQGADLTFYRSSSLNTVCGSALALEGVTPRLQMIENYVARAGTHNVLWMWSDGITITESPDSVIKGNTVVEATDVDLIFGGCTNCDISSNRISHSDSFEHSSFAAFMIYAWPGQTGDYSGTTVTDNHIDCGNYRCGFGFLMGSEPWHPGLLKGGRYFGNSVKGAQIGFAVNNATDPSNPVTIGGNAVTNSGGTFWAQQGLRQMPSWYISQKSRNAVRFEDGLSLADWPVDDMTSNIPNWITQDWTSVAGAGPFSPITVAPAVVVPVAATPPQNSSVPGVPSGNSDLDFIRTTSFTYFGRISNSNTAVEKQLNFLSRGGSRATLKNYFLYVRDIWLQEKGKLPDYDWVDWEVGLFIDGYSVQTIREAVRAL